ncbi:amidohydrolase, partial [Rhizobium ruizarguesonis]
KIQDTFTQEAIRSSIRLYQINGDVFSNAKVDGSTPLHTGLRDFEGQSHFRAGSTDVGDLPGMGIGADRPGWRPALRGRR